MSEKGKEDALTKTYDFMLWSFPQIARFPCVSRTGITGDFMDSQDFSRSKIQPILQIPKIPVRIGSPNPDPTTIHHLDSTMPPDKPDPPNPTPPETENETPEWLREIWGGSPISRTPSPTRRRKTWKSPDPNWDCRGFLGFTRIPRGKIP
jgi:hypothetical protein